jgi:hypothetical protein
VSEPLSPAAEAVLAVLDEGSGRRAAWFVARTGMKTQAVFHALQELAGRGDAVLEGLEGRPMHLINDTTRVYPSALRETSPGRRREHANAVHRAASETRQPFQEDEP